MLAGLKGAGIEGSRLGTIALCYVGLESVVERYGWNDIKEIAAGIGTGAIFSGVCE